MPYPNFHACRLADPKEFTEGSFKNIASKDGKAELVMAKRPGSSKLELQSIRYPKSQWTSEAAKGECEKHSGSFEAATSKSALVEAIEDLVNKEYVETGTLAKGIPMDMSIGDMMSALRAALDALFPYDSKSDNNTWASIVETYLDGSCIVRLSDKTKGERYMEYEWGITDGVASLTNPQEVTQEWKVIDEEPDEPESTSKAKWTAAFINNLPDSCFAYVEAGGTKDDQGKTTPRSLRHLPYKNADGSVDMPHLRNALSRAPQTDLPQATKDKIITELKAAAKKAGIGDEAVKKIMEEEDVDIFVPIIKADDEKQVVYGVVLEPEVGDAQNDIISAAEIEKACHDFMRGYRAQKTGMGLMHKREAPEFEIVENAIAPMDFKIGKEKVKKGSWYMATYVGNKKVWKAVKEGKITGYSIGGRGQHE